MIENSVGTVYVMLGTKAQYIKTAPVVHELQRGGASVRLIDLGQHGALTATLRDELKLPEPEVFIGGAADVTSIRQALSWSLRVAKHLLNGRRTRRELFPEVGISVVHGDTPSTFLATLIARRCGQPVAHLEAGLRSTSIWEPFPEEVIRRVVMRLSHVLYAPNEQAVEVLRSLRVRGAVVPTAGNTSSDVLWQTLDVVDSTGVGPAVLTMHRVENLHRQDRLLGFVQLAIEAAALSATILVLHGPTKVAIAPYRLQLERAGVKLVDLLPHADFLRLLQRAAYVVTDGGSIQEECAQLGVPTLLWRSHTERPDGLESNVVLSAYEPALVARFLDDPEVWRRPASREQSTFECRPSRVIAHDLIARLRSLSSDESK